MAKKYVSLDKLGLYDEKIKKVISDGDAATLASAQEFATNLGVNYDVAGAAATVQGKLDEEVTRAKAKEDELVAKDTALQKEIDDLETLVGVLPETSAATDIVGYVQEKTSGIATSENLAELTNRVAQAETDIDNIEKDYLKTADKTELADAITAEQTRAEGIEAGLRTDVDAIKGDYLKTTDKTELQGNIDTVSGTLADVKADVDAFFADADMTESAKDTLKELQTYIASDETAASEMLASIQQNGQDIDAVEGRLDVVEPKVTTLEGEMDDAQAAISALQGAVGDSGSVKDMIDDAVNAEKERAMGVEADIQADADKGIEDAASALVAANAASAHADELNTAMDTRVKVVEAKAHEHANKALLDTYTQTEANLADAVAKKHEHSNLAVLEGITADKVTNWDKVGEKADQTALQSEIDRATAAEQALGARIDEFVECSQEDINNLFVTV